MTYCKQNYFYSKFLFNYFKNRIGSVMVSVLVSSAVDRGFESRADQTKDYEIGICCFSAKHSALGEKSKDWLPRNRNNVYAFSVMIVVLLS